MNAWLGHSHDELLSAWGAPTSRHTRPGGGTVLTWSEVQRGRLGDQVSCRRSFTTDRSGTIVDWSLRDCDWRATRIPQPRTPMSR
jgi:hypothetical protein